MQKLETKIKDVLEKAKIITKLMKNAKPPVPASSVVIPVRYTRQINIYKTLQKEYNEIEKDLHFLSSATVNFAGRQSRLITLFDKYKKTQEVI